MGERERTKTLTCVNNISINGGRGGGVLKHSAKSLRHLQLWLRSVADVHVVFTEVAVDLGVLLAPGAIAVR